MAIVCHMDPIFGVQVQVGVIVCMHSNTARGEGGGRSVGCAVSHNTNITWQQHPIIPWVRLPVNQMSHLVVPACWHTLSDLSFERYCCVCVKVFLERVKSATKYFLIQLRIVFSINSAN